MGDRKNYSFTWQAYGSIMVRAASQEEAEEQALDAIGNLVSADPGQLTVQGHDITARRISQ